MTEAEMRIKERRRVHGKVHRAVHTALKNGVLVRPSQCSRCGCTPPLTASGSAAIQAHHHDYSKPLDVEWLCPKCHRAITPWPAVRGGLALGEKNGQAKLTEADVISARRLRTVGMPWRAIAARFDVDKMTVKRAVRGTLWTHVKDLL